MWPTLVWASWWAVTSRAVAAVVGFRWPLWKPTSQVLGYIRARRVPVAASFLKQQRTHVCTQLVAGRREHDAMRCEAERKWLRAWVPYGPRPVVDLDMVAGVRTCVLARWRRWRPESSSYRTGSRARWIGQAYLHSAMHVLCELREAIGGESVCDVSRSSGHYQKKGGRVRVRACMHRARTPWWPTRLTRKLHDEAPGRELQIDRPPLAGSEWRANHAAARFIMLLIALCASSSLMCRTSVGRRRPLSSPPLGGNKGITSAG